MQGDHEPRAEPPERGTQGGSGMSAAGSKVARLVALTMTDPTIGTLSECATTTSTVRGFQLSSTGQVHRTSETPFNDANRAASCVGDPRAPNGRKVTGAAASAAASAALAA
jgi:hypothetical protein